jgi:hypothetical protein
MSPMHMNPVFDKLPIRLSSNFNVERGQFLGYIESSNPRPNKCSLSTGSDNRAVDICNVGTDYTPFFHIHGRHPRSLLNVNIDNVDIPITCRDYLISFMENIGHE